MQTLQKKRDVSVDGRFRWTRARYEQAIVAGVFGEGDRIELINGELIEMSPQRSFHSTGIRLLADALRRCYAGRRYVVDVQLPLALGKDSEPEPVVAVVPGNLRDYLNSHPTTATLVVEVSDTTLKQDRTVKARLYARHSIPEYWILNITEECLEVYRDPANEVYQTKQTFRRSDTITPPESVNDIAVADLLP